MNKLLLLLILLLPSADAAGQTTTTIASRVRGTVTLPATCTAGNNPQVYVDTNATAGSRFYICTSTNTWTVQGGGTFAVGGDVSGGTDTRLFFQDGSVIGQDSGLTFTKASDQLNAGRFAVAGTGGAGFIQLTDQSSDPTGDFGVKLFSDANSFFAVKSNSGSGFVFRFDDSALSASRTYSLPNVAGVFTVGPTSATDNAVARFDGTLGKVQNSGVTIGDTGIVAASSVTLSSATPLTMANTASDAATTNNTLCITTTSGVVTKGSGTLGICLGTSSARYKHGINPFTLGLSAVTKLQPKRFFYNTGYGDSGVKESVGFIAEESMRTFPNLVGLDASGRPNTFDMMGLIPSLVNSIKELNAKVDAQAREIKRLRRQRR